MGLEIIAVALSLAQQPSPRTLESREAAERQLIRMTTDQRLAHASKAVAADPASIDRQLELAAAFLQKMRETSDPDYLERASTALNTVLGKQPSHYEALRLRNELALERHNFEEAAGSARALTRLQPTDASAWGMLADALFELGDYDGAATAVEEMLTLRPGLGSFNRAAWYRFLTGDTAGAVEFMRKAIRAGSASAEHMAWSWTELGGLEFRRGALNEAAVAYEQALRYLPSYHRALDGRGKVLAAKGDLAGAIEAYKMAQAATPWPEYAAALHHLYRRLGQDAEAKKQLALVDVIDRMGKLAREKGNRALVYIYADLDHRLDRAVELAKGELSIRRDVYTYDALSWAYFKAGMLGEAVEASSKAMAFGTEEPVFLYHAAMIARAKGDTDRARTLLGRALALNPAFDLAQAPQAVAVLRSLGGAGLVAEK